MLVRRERGSDLAAVRGVVQAAFGRREEPLAVAVEVALVEALRTGQEWLPALALVAEVEQEVVGYVVCTRAWVDEQPVLGLGPLAVAPTHQRQGVGSALVHAVLGGADALGEPLVVLLGSTVYYPRFGFVPGSSLEIEAPDPSWGNAFQARVLSTYEPSMRGLFRYAPPFEAL